MRIALTNNFFLPRASGSVHLTDALARGYAARGHDVLVVTAGEGSVSTETRAGYRVVRLPGWSLPKTPLSMNYDIPVTLGPRTYRRLSRLLDEFNPDVIHQHGQFFDLTWMSSAWARRRHVPTVTTVHTALTHTDPKLQALLRLADLSLVRPILAASQTHLVTIDWFIDDYVRRTYDRRGRRTAFVPIGVDPETLASGDGSRPRAALGLGDRPVVLSLGHVIPLRDRLALVAAMPFMIDARPDIAVVVAGTVYDERFLDLAQRLGVSDNLVVTGPIPHDDVPDYVAMANVEGHDFQNYGLGTASLEVMAAGVPVVSVVRTDNFPGLELVSWENVVIVPPDDPRALADAVLRLLDDPELAGRLGARQRQFIVEHFSIDRVTDRYLELLQTAVG